MSLETISTNKAFGGTQGVYRHASKSTGTDMTFSVYVPPHNDGAKLPVLWFLSGLTCTHANVTEKGEYRRACADLGIILVAPDTSPRGDGVADDPSEAYDFGLGAGFYVDATQTPFAKHYKMRSYIEDELPKLIAQHFPADMSAQIAPWIAGGTVNVLGGCCGTTPDHIAAIAAAANGQAPRVPVKPKPTLRLSGLEPFQIAV